MLFHFGHFNFFLYNIFTTSLELKLWTLPISKKISLSPLKLRYVSTFLSFFFDYAFYSFRSILFCYFFTSTFLFVLLRFMLYKHRKEVNFYVTYILLSYWLRKIERTKTKKRERGIYSFFYCFTSLLTFWMKRNTHTWQILMM